MAGSEKLILRQIPDTKSYSVYWSNDKYIGQFIVDVDGYYYFWPIREGGCWSEYVLRIIADKLKELNATWGERIKKDLGVYDESDDK